jgi:hypothetical protein
LGRVLDRLTVVVPGDQLDEVLVEGDTGLGIEDGGVGVAVQVGGDDLILGVGKDACYDQRQIP